MMLNNIKDNPGAFSLKKRLGRGIGSGKGKTCGRGVKGQKSRSGVSINGFEGGQMSIYRRLPKRGFRSHKPVFASLNIGDLQNALNKGKLQSSINIQTLKAARLITGKAKGVRILGKGTINTSLSLTVNGVSASARQKIESMNGVINLKAIPKNLEGKRIIRKNESLNKYKKAAV